MTSQQWKFYKKNAALEGNMEKVTLLTVFILESRVKDRMFVQKMPHRYPASSTTYPAGFGARPWQRQSEHLLWVANVQVTYQLAQRMALLIHVRHCI